MTLQAWVEGTNAFYFAAKAHLVEENRELAWAEKHVVQNPAHAWVLGRYVEANKANSNRQYFELGRLRMAQPTIAHAPMNINHESSHIVGSFVATELVYPAEAAAGEPQNPYIEALGVVWKAYFPSEYAEIQKANREGRLFYSMECVPRQMGCIGEGGCGQVFDYAGLMSDTYCAHLNERTSDRDLIAPHFTAGALILPPVRPGWSQADVQTLVANSLPADKVLAEVAANVDELKQSDWELAMEALLNLTELSRSFSPDERKALAKSGKAMSDGSFPIVTVADLKNAIQAVGRASNPGKAKSHIVARAKALGVTNLLPEGWS